MQDILLFLVGILVGAMNAIAGGGMLLGFPILLSTGMPAMAANITTNLIVLPGNLAATYGYRKYLKRVPRQYLLLLIPTVIGAVVGALILRNTPSSDFERYVPGLVLFAVVLFAFQPFLHQYLHQHLHGPKRLRQQLKPLLLVSLAMFPLSIYGGYFGAGFGFIMLSFLGFTRLRAHMHRMNALKSVAATCISAVSLICLLSTGLVEWHAGLVMAGGNMIGGYYGAVATQKISSHSIRIIVIVIGLATATYLGFRNY